MGTSLPGFFAAGNIVHVYDLVDWVTMAGEIAGRSAADYALGKSHSGVARLRTVASQNVRYVVPHWLDPGSLESNPQQLQLRVRQPIEAKVNVVVTADGVEILRKTERYVRPGEMVFVKLTSDLYERLPKVAKELRVSVHRL
jgi:succinate dehydrogenase/fumarate reductase flavoprotein subunit